ncbi:MAG: pilus assembly protein [Micropruina sp.]|nr:pilus assembly protein [Micropruina sp.]
MATALTLIVGIAVDLTGQIHAKQHAGEVAAQAARLAGQQLNTDQYQAGEGRLEVGARQARATAVDFIERSGMTGTLTFTSPTSLQVTTRAPYTPLFLSLVGVGQVHVTGQATISTIRVLEGTPR